MFKSGSMEVIGFLILLMVQYLLLLKKFFIYRNARKKMASLTSPLWEGWCRFLIWEIIYLLIFIVAWIQDIIIAQASKWTTFGKQITLKLMHCRAVWEVWGIWSGRFQVQNFEKHNLIKLIQSISLFISTYIQTIGNNIIIITKTIYIIIIIIITKRSSHHFHGQSPHPSLLFPAIPDHAQIKCALSEFLV